MRKPALVVAAIVVAALGVLATRVVLEGRRALARGDEAMAGGRRDDAIAAWETAARWYLPAAPHVELAYDRLRAVANGGAVAASAPAGHDDAPRLPGHADHAHALAAWRAIRSAALATRGLWTPHADDLAAANAAIAELSSRDPEGAAAAGPDHGTRQRWQTQRLARAPGPSSAAAGLAIAGIALWLAGIGVVVLRGLDAAGTLVRRPALIGGFLTTIGLAGWLVGLYNA